MADLVETMFKTGGRRPQKRRKLDSDRHYKVQRLRCLEEARYRCQVRTADCTHAATTAHHVAGRTGADPHRLSNLLACCDQCHNLSPLSIHSNPEWATQMGYMRSRTVPLPSAYTTVPRSTLLDDDELIEVYERDNDVEDVDPELYEQWKHERGYA